MCPDVSEVPEQLIAKGKSSHRKTILVVDDDPDIRQTVTETLEGEGYIVQTAANGKEALATIASMPTDPCLVLLDMSMPVMSGPESLGVLEQEHRIASLPIVVSSAHARPSDAPGVRKMIRKPVSLELLLAVVKEFCAA